jgi:hypothetical protein
MEKVNIDENIVMFNEFITKEECDMLLSIVNIANDDDWWVYTNSKYDKTNEWEDRILFFRKIKKFNKFNKIFDKFFLKTQKVLNQNYGCDLNYTDMCAIYRSRDGEKMNVHYDQGGDKKIKYGAVLYLNDEFDDGEIYYPNIGIEIKPKAGTLIVHPSNKKYSHGVKPVKNGTRYCTTTFLF